MPRFTFAAFVSLVLAGPVGAQRVAGRDLLDFPLGLLAEPAPFSSRMPGGLWNPATTALSTSIRGEFGFAGLTTPQEQGVNLEMVAAAYNIRPRLTGSLSFAQASVNDILKTETDPVSLGGAFEIPYGTTLLSAGLATVRDNVTVGLSTRYRWGTADTEHAGAFTLDGGAIVDGIAGIPVRVAASTFLLSPSHGADAATYLAAADAPVIRRDSTVEVRGGYSLAVTQGRGREEYFFTTSSYQQFDASTGMSRATEFGNVSWRWRLGLGLRHAGYTVAIGREDGAAGFSASYQFLLTRAIR